MSNLIPPNREKKILLHSCCAPCSGGILKEIVSSGISCALIFYNPNIHPENEYNIRKEAISKFAEKIGVPFVDLDYNSDNWFERIKGMEKEPEKGKRCAICFDMRLERAAFYAHENNFSVFATTLGISRWKDMREVNKSGLNAAKKYQNLIFWDYNWRKNDGIVHMYKTAKEEHFYKQKYCGCEFSLEHQNNRRIKCGNPPINYTPEYY